MLLNSRASLTCFRACFLPGRAKDLSRPGKYYISYTESSKFFLIDLKSGFAVPVKLVGLMKMCLIETYSRVWVGKHLSDLFPIRNGLKKGDALSQLLFNFSLEFAIRRVQVNQDDLKLNGTLQLLVYADGANILGGNVRTIEKNTEAFLVASKEFGQEVYADTTKYMVTSRDQDEGRSHSIKINNSSFERMEEFKYLGKTLTNKKLYSGRN